MVYYWNLIKPRPEREPCRKSLAGNRECRRYRTACAASRRSNFLLRINPPRNRYPGQSEFHSCRKLTNAHVTLIKLLTRLVRYVIRLLIPSGGKERGAGERKRRPAPRLSPYQTSSTSPSLPASSHASVNALQAASHHVIAALLPPSVERATASRPSRTRRRRLAGRGPGVKRPGRSLKERNPYLR